MVSAAGVGHARRHGGRRSCGRRGPPVRRSRPADGRRRPSRRHRRARPRRRAASRRTPASTGARGVVEPGADAEAVERPDVARRQLEAPRDRALRLGRREHPSSRSRSSALRAIGPNTLMSASVVPPPTWSRYPRCGIDAEARLQPEHAAAVRRDAHRAADVGAELEAGEPGGDRGRRAARRATGDAVDVPRVVRGAEDLVEGLRCRPTTAAAFVLPNTIAPAALSRATAGASSRGHVVGQLDGAAGRADALGLDRVLDRDRQAVERAELVAARGAASAASAAARARSTSSVTTALTSAFEPVDAVEVAARAAPGSRAAPARIAAASFDCGPGRGRCRPPRRLLLERPLV